MKQKLKETTSGLWWLHNEFVEWRINHGPQIESNLYQEECTFEEMYYNSWCCISDKMCVCKSKWWDLKDLGGKEKKKKQLDFPLRPGHQANIWLSGLTVVDSCQPLSAWSAAHEYTALTTADGALTLLFCAYAWGNTPQIHRGWYTVLFIQRIFVWKHFSKMKDAKANSQQANISVIIEQQR